MKKRTLRSNQETDEGKRCAALANSLTKKAPYKGLGAESEEKREPVSDIDTGVADSLKVLDPDGRLEKPTLLGAVGTAEKCQEPTHAPQQNRAYSITASAIEIRSGGTSRPIARAVLRLMTNSYLVGSSTGR